MRVDRTRPVNPGLLRERVHFQRRTEGAANTYGEPAVTWATYQTCQAAVTALRGRELEAAQQTWAEARFRVDCHYFVGVLREDRIVWGDFDGAGEPLSTARLLDVLDAEDPSGNREKLTVYAKTWAT